MNGYTFVYGTRPEAIKIKTIIENLETLNFRNYNVIYTGQQFDYALDFSQNLELYPNIIMKLSDTNFTLTALFSEILRGLTEYDQSINSSVIVQGDTLSALVAGIYTKLTKRNLIHVEAGLRSYDKSEPFPEEISRVVIDHLCDVHITPTEQAKQNLINEGVAEEKIYNFGQTGIDRLIKLTQDKSEAKNLVSNSEINKSLIENKKKILITLHRKENITNIREICETINSLSRTLQRCQFTFIMHSNPGISNEQRRVLNERENLSLKQPQSYFDMLSEILQSDLILTDSGGIQEECAVLNKPIYVLRNSTERPEILDGNSRIVKANYIKDLEKDLMIFITKVRKPLGLNSKLISQYGSGMAGLNIAEFLIKKQDGAN